MVLDFIYIITEIISPITHLLIKINDRTDSLKSAMYAIISSAFGQWAILMLCR